MRALRVIFLISISFFLYGCKSTEDNYISTVDIEVEASTSERTFIIEVRALDPPQHLDFTAMENANLFHTDKHQKTTIVFERNIRYNIKVYSTSSNNDTEIEKGNFRAYMNNLIYEEEQSFNDKRETLTVKDK